MGNISRMTKKDEQRIEMRAKILTAAIEAYADLGFVGASTREIAKRAGISQGLLTYHFKNKNELWFAAVDQMFEHLREEIGGDFFDDEVNENPRILEDRLAKFLDYNSRNPHLLRFAIDTGKEMNERSEYLIDKHIRPIYNNFKKQLPPALQGDMAPHVFYAWMGAATTIFTIPAECKYLTGTDPASPEAVKRHTELIGHLFLPGNALSMMWKALRGGLGTFRPDNS